MEHLPIELLYQIIDYLLDINNIIRVNKYLFEVIKKYIINHKFI